MGITKICVIYGNDRLECGKHQTERAVPRFLEALKKNPQSVDDFIQIFNTSRYPRNFDWYNPQGERVKITMSKRSFEFEDRTGIPIEYASDEHLDKDTKLGMLIIDLNNKNLIHLDNDSDENFLDYPYIDKEKSHPPSKKKYEKCIEGKPDEKRYGSDCYRDAYWIEVKPPKDFKVRRVDFSTLEERQNVMMELFECPERTSEFYRSVGKCL